MNKILDLKNKEDKLVEELSQCTFYPKLNKQKLTKEKSNSNVKDGNFYDRLANWQNKLIKKYDNFF